MTTSSRTLDETGLGELAHRWGPLAEPMHAMAEFPPDGSRWGENAYWTFWDQAANAFGHFHFMTSPNGEGRRIRVAAVCDGVLHEIIEPLTLLTPGADPLRYESDSITAHLAGRVHADDGALRVDLTYEPLRPAAEYTAGAVLPSLPGTKPLEHFQRSGRVRGEVTVGGATRSIDGLAVRDRTWGFRDESRSWIEFYACFLCFEDYDVAVMKYRSPHLGDRVDGHLPGLSRQVTASRAVRDAAADLRGLDLTLDGDDELSVRVIGRPLARIPIHVGAGDNSVPAFHCYDEVVAVRTSTGDEGIGTFQQGTLLGLA